MAEPRQETAQQRQQRMQTAQRGRQDQRQDARQGQPQQTRDTRPGPEGEQSTKGAEVNPETANPLSLANEIDDGDGGARIPPPRPVPPGEDQPGLIGGVGIEGSGNVEPEPYPPDAPTYPPIRDETQEPEARAEERTERDGKRREFDDKITAGEIEGAGTKEDQIAYATEEAERLKTQSEDLTKQRREADAERQQKKADDAQAARKERAPAR